MVYLRIKKPFQNRSEEAFYVYFAGVGSCFGQQNESWVEANPSEWLQLPPSIFCDLNPGTVPAFTSTATGNGATSLMEYLFQGQDFIRPTDNAGLPALTPNSNYIASNFNPIFEKCTEMLAVLSDDNSESTCGILNASQASQAATIEGWILVPCDAIGIVANVFTKQKYRALAISETGNPEEWEYGFEGYTINNDPLDTRDFRYDFKTNCTDNDNNCGSRVMWFRAYSWDPRAEGQFSLALNYGDRVEQINSEIVSSVDPRIEPCEVYDECKQLITITNNTPFVMSNIQWPLDYETAGACSLADLSPGNLPEIYGFPMYLAGDDECSLLGYDYEDKVFTVSPGSGECAHIERTWTVINWCSQVNGEFDKFIIPRAQIIKLNNTVAPAIEDQGPVVQESQNVDCESGLIEVTRTAIDDCDNPLDWSYEVTEVSTGLVVATGESSTLSEIFTAGNYSIEWQVQDGCGNFDFDVQLLTVINTKVPTPVCLNGLSGTLVGDDTDGDGVIDTETIELWASDFDGGSYHTCDNPITLSLSSDTLIKNVTYDCSDIGIQEVELWVTDRLTGAQDFCSTFILIEDEGLCPDNNMVVVDGEIYTEIQERVEQVEVHLGDTQITDMTEEDGIYAFGNMPMGGSYDVRPEKDIEYLNGVSTLDLVLMQRHILGIESLNSPYKLIAADVNQSDNISATDLVELRKLILGIYEELPTNTSWRFVDAAYEFADESDPWLFGFDESYEIFDLQNDMHLDFIGVKIGDVNNTVIANAESTLVDNRSSRWALTLNIQSETVSAGDETVVRFRSGSYERVSGWQGTIEFDPSAVEILEVRGKALDLTEENYYTGRQSEGWMTISYHDSKAQDVESSETLFEIVIRAKSDINVENAFTLTSKVTETEAYRGYNEVVDMKLESSIEELASILSVNPNPWIDQTDVSFTMPESGEGRWEFYDVNGRLIYTRTETYSIGDHKMVVKREDIRTSGIVYIKLVTDGGIAEYKMMVIN